MGFSDIFARVKRDDNEAALRLYPSITSKLDLLNELDLIDKLFENMLGKLCKLTKSWQHVRLGFGDCN